MPDAGYRGKSHLWGVWGVSSILINYTIAAQYSILIPATLFVCLRKYLRRTPNWLKKITMPASSGSHGEVAVSTTRNRIRSRQVTLHSLLQSPFNNSSHLRDISTGCPVLAVWKICPFVTLNTLLMKREGRSLFYSCYVQYLRTS